MDGIMMIIQKKAYKDNGWNFRVFVTDDENNPVNVRAKIKRGPENRSNTRFQYSEVLDYPYSKFNSSERADCEEACYRLAVYFDELESAEAIRYYGKSIKEKSTPLKKYLLANSLYRESRGDKDSSFFFKGQKLIDELSLKHKEIIIPPY